jgi:hypothetical protein
MIKVPIVILVFILSSLISNAQVEFDELTEDDFKQTEFSDIDSAVIGRYNKALVDLEESLRMKDPFGYYVGVKISQINMTTGKGEMYENHVWRNSVMQQTLDFSKSQNFEKFGFDVRPDCVNDKPGIFVYTEGLAAELVSNNPIQYLHEVQYFTHFSRKDGVSYKYIVQIAAIALVEKPDNGSIMTDVYYYDKDGGKQLWDLSFGDVMPKIAYTRVGPGNDITNTKRDVNLVRSPDRGRVIIADSFNPGYYMPVIKFRGCVQEFTDYDDYKDYSVVLRLEKNVLSWSNVRVFSDGTVVPQSNLRTEALRAGDLNSYYSKGNTIKITVRDPGTFDKMTGYTVVLKPKYSPANFTTKELITEDGECVFEEVESGIYEVYVNGQEKHGKQIEVCNCPQKNETYNNTHLETLFYYPNYTVTAEYKNPKLFSASVKWENVNIAFPEDINEMPAIVERPLDGSDIDMYELEPPFTLKLPFGLFSFYSNMPEANEDGIVEKKTIHNNNFKKCIIEGGSFAIKKNKRDGPNIIAMAEFNVELRGEDESEFLLIPVVAGNVNANGPYAFKWDKLDEDIITKLKLGNPATKTLTNSEGATMIISFEPKK